MNAHRLTDTKAILAHVSILSNIPLGKSFRSSYSYYLRLKYFVCYPTKAGGFRNGKYL